MALGFSALLSELHRVSCTAHSTIASSVGSTEHAPDSWGCERIKTVLEITIRKSGESSHRKPLTIHEKRLDILCTKSWSLEAQERRGGPRGKARPAKRV